MKLSEAVRYRAAIEKASESLADEELLEVPNLAPGWAPDGSYAPGNRVCFQGILYKCLQAHTVQSGWTPPAAPSLWTRVLIPDGNTIPEWVQPESTNPYSKGDRVRFEGKVYESLIDGNIWSPAAYPGGWKEIAE